MMTALSACRCLWLFVIACSTGAICTLTVSAEDRTIEPAPLSAEKKKLAASLFLKIKESRQQLRSGTFEATESTERGDDKAKATLFCAFDLVKKRLRYDYLHDDVRNTARYFRTAERSAIYSPETGYLIIMKPDGLSAKSNLRPLNIRMIGFGTFGEHRTGWTFDKLLAFHTKNCTLTDLRKEDGGIYHLTMSHGSPTVIERHIWIDGANGYTPIRYRVRFFNPKTKEWSDPRESVETKWAKRSGVWVPESVIAKRDGRVETVWQLTIQWKSINKGVADSHFQRKSLKAKPGTLVVDNRSGKPVIVEKIESGN